MTNRWHGPAPSARHQWLLKACLDTDLANAGASWRAWRDHCDFEAEDAVSHELASLAVTRLGRTAAGGGVAVRSLGWFRRACLLSELAADTAMAVAQACREHGRPATAVGDVAGWLSGTTFAGHRLPIRRIVLVVPNVDARLRQQLLAIAAKGRAGAAVERGHLALRILGESEDRLAAAGCASATLCGDLAVPSPGALVAQLTAGNWCWDPPDRLRWMVEVAALVQKSLDLDALASEMAEVLAHADVSRAGERALLALRALLPDEASRQCLDPLIEAAAAVPDGPGARIRGRLRLLPCGLPLARLQHRLRRWRGLLPTGC
jgi:hypothetical protein